MLDLVHAIYFYAVETLLELFVHRIERHVWFFSVQEIFAAKFPHYDYHKKRIVDQQVFCRFPREEENISIQQNDKANRLAIAKINNTLS